jgi:hypothetical protein
VVGTKKGGRKETPKKIKKNIANTDLERRKR